MRSASRGRCVYTHARKMRRQTIMRYLPRPWQCVIIPACWVPVITGRVITGSIDESVEWMDKVCVDSIWNVFHGAVSQWMQPRGAGSIPVRGRVGHVAIVRYRWFWPSVTATTIFVTLEKHRCDTGSGRYKHEWEHCPSAISPHIHSLRFQEFNRNTIWHRLVTCIVSRWIEDHRVCTKATQLDNDKNAGFSGFHGVMFHCDDC